jgi:hypothetical protein
MASNFDDVNAAEALDRIWDRAVLGELMDERDLELADLDSIAKLKACDDTPEPDDAFVEQLRRQFIVQHEHSGPSIRPSAASLGIVKQYSAPWPAIPIRRFLIAAAVAACLTLIVSVGSGLFHDQAHAPVIASVLASPEETATAGPTMTTWMQQTSAVSTNHNVTLVPHFAATVTTSDLDVLAPRTPLTIVEIASDGTGQQWLHVQTSDGRKGWLPQGDAYPIQQ